MSRKKTTQPTIEQQLAAREQALNETLAEMVTTIDTYMRLSPLHFIEGKDSAGGWYAFPSEYPGQFNKFTAWNERWMGVLFPYTLECQQKIQDAYPETGKIKGDIDSAYMDLCFDVQRFGFLLGYLLGCRTMGASNEEVLTRAKAFTIETVTRTRADIEHEQNARQHLR